MPLSSVMLAKKAAKPLIGRGIIAPASFAFAPKTRV